MIKSDLLFEDAIQRRIEELNKVKDYLVLAATGEVEKNDPIALEHLQALAYLTRELNDLLRNLPFITVDIDELSNS